MCLSLSRSPQDLLLFFSSLLVVVVRVFQAVALRQMGQGQRQREQTLRKLLQLLLICITKQAIAAPLPLPRSLLLSPCLNQLIHMYNSLPLQRILWRNAAACAWANANGSMWPRVGAFSRPTMAARRYSCIRWVKHTHTYTHI